MLRDIFGRSADAEHASADSSVSIAGHVLTGLDEIESIAARGVTFEALTPEVGSVLHAVPKLIASLRRAQHEPVASAVEASLKRFTSRLDANTYDEADRYELPVKRLNQSEEFAIVNHEVDMIGLQIAALTDQLGNNDRTKAIDLCAPLPLHLRAGWEGAESIVDRRVRLELVSTVEDVSSKMDSAAEILSMKPRMQWDQIFASMFDAENVLRRTVGLVPKMRPYSGQIDPATALAKFGEMRQAVIDGKPVEGKATPCEDPQSAVASIAGRLGAAFAYQQTAVDTFGRLITEPPITKPPSTFQILVGIAAKVALSMAAGGIASVVAKKLGKQLDESFPEPKVDTSKVAGGVASYSFALRKAIAVDGAKDGVKELFKGLMMASWTPHKVSSTDPVTEFVMAQRLGLIDAAANANDALIGLSSALAQVDLETLNQVLAGLGVDFRDEVLALQLHHTMLEWENLKARLATGAHDAPDVTHASARDAHMNKPANGALEIELYVDSDPAKHYVRPVKIGLVGAEAYALRYFRENNLTLASCGLNQRYRLEFSRIIEIHQGYAGFGPDKGLQPETLQPLHLQQLKIYRSGDVVDEQNLLRAEDGHYDGITDHRALTQARQLIESIADTKLDRLEGV